MEMKLDRVWDSECFSFQHNLHKSHSIGQSDLDSPVNNDSHTSSNDESDGPFLDTLPYRLNTFRRNRELCDVVLFVHEKEILAHKVVLAACSPALMDMFIGSESMKSLQSLSPGSQSPSTLFSKPLPNASKLSPTNTVGTVTPHGPASPTSQQRPALSYYEFAHADYDCFEAIVSYAYTAQ
ncbi:unnamed protein product [Gongylonema pulchrum]|uniref:BTB domain-containing protein n=1 Tax=Gongylonema pulchrum TaxID=637853 RepID=A0A183E8Q1_9BILA|nr:unnamed protein product [Gongylonema pulchrum]